MRSLAAPALSATTIAVFGILATPSASADATAYLFNVMVRPGYHFASAADALTYGQGICDQVAQGRGYADLMNNVKADFGTTDEYQASYLITQAVNELCPALIWQLRNSAGHYRPPAS
jgi:Protein of unknown function (DUF732)